MKITAESKKIAAGLFERNPLWKKLYVNKEGHFFTTEDYAGKSVKSPDEYALLERESVLTQETLKESRAGKELKNQTQAKNVNS